MRFKRYSEEIGLARVGHICTDAKPVLVMLQRYYINIEFMTILMQCNLEDNLESRLADIFTCTH